MIKGYEEETKPLTDKELELVPLIIRGLKSHVGEKNKISNRAVCEILKSKGIRWLTEPRFRKIVNHIRAKRLILYLIADNRGYWIATSIQEFKDWIESMEQRISSMQNIVDVAKSNLEGINENNPFYPC